MSEYGGVVLYRSCNQLDGTWGNWVVGSYGPGEFAPKGCLDFSPDACSEFATLQEAIEEFKRRTSEDFPCGPVPDQAA